MVYQTLFFPSECKRKKSGLATRDYTPIELLHGQLIIIYFTMQLGTGGRSQKTVYTRCLPVSKRNYTYWVISKEPAGAIRYNYVIKWCWCNDTTVIYWIMPHVQQTQTYVNMQVWLLQYFTVPIIEKSRGHKCGVQLKLTCGIYTGPQITRFIVLNLIRDLIVLLL